MLANFQKEKTNLCRRICSLRLKSRVMEHPVEASATRKRAPPPIGAYLRLFIRSLNKYHSAREYAMGKVIEKSQIARGATALAE